MQLYVGVEFLFPLAKPKRSFQNLTETRPGKRVFLSSFCFPKVVKMATKNENRLTKKTFTHKNDLDYNFFHCENVSKGCNHFLGKKILLFGNVELPQTTTNHRKPLITPSQTSQTSAKTPTNDMNYSFIPYLGYLKMG